MREGRHHFPKIFCVHIRNNTPPATLQSFKSTSATECELPRLGDITWDCGTVVRGQEHTDVHLPAHAFALKYHQASPNNTVPCRSQEGKKFFPYVYRGLVCHFSSISKSSSHLTLYISLLPALNKL